MTTSSTASAGPVVAIIVPVYRAEQFVAATLESIRAQTFANWECIVVDDGSPDSSADLVMSITADEPRMRLHRQANAGVSAARNAGLAQMSPAVRYVAFVDSDDLWVPTALADLLSEVEGDPRAVGVYGYAELIDEAGRPVSTGDHPARQRDRRRIRGWRLDAVAEHDPLVFDEAVVVGPLWPPAVALHRRDVLDLVGGFDPTLSQMEDWEHCQRMVRHGHYRVLPQQVAWYRRHDAQATHSHLAAAVQADQVRYQTWASRCNSPAQRRAATMAFRQLQLRHTGRAAQRLVNAVRRRDWTEVLPLAAGTAVLAAQNLRRGPPRVTWLTARQLDWSRRTAQSSVGV